MDDFIDPDAGDGFVDPDASSALGETVKAAAIAGGAGALTGLSGWGAGHVLSSAFPGVFAVSPGEKAKPAMHNAITNLDSAIKRGDSTMSFQKLFSEYMGDVVNSGKGLTFADWIEQHGDYKVLSSTVKDALAHSGKEVPVLQDMRLRDAGTKDRVLGDLSSTLGVPRQDLNVTLEQLKKAKSKAAEPLYAEAFKYKNPIQDPRLYELFGTDTPNMSMMNALKDRINTLGLKGQEPPSLFASDPTRKDWWKRLSTSDVPEHLFAGEEWNKLREFYAPAIEDLHHMRKNLWDNYSALKRKGESEKAGAYLDSWKKVTNYLDNETAGAYKIARQKYAGDSKLEYAAELGGNLLKEKPEVIRKALLTMSPEERTALAQGFYGNVQSLYDAKGPKGTSDLLRAEEARNALSAIYTNPAQRDDFIAKIHAEAAMRDSLQSYASGRAPHVSGTMPAFHRAAAVVAGATGHVPSMLYHGFGGARSEPSKQVSRAITDMAFKEPVMNGRNAVFPEWYRDAGRSIGETLKRLPRSRWTAIPAALGALGTFGAMGGFRGSPSAPAPLTQQAEEPMMFP